MQYGMCPLAISLAKLQIARLSLEGVPGMRFCNSTRAN